MCDLRPQQIDLFAQHVYSQQVGDHHDAQRDEEGKQRSVDDELSEGVLSQQALVVSGECDVVGKRVVLQPFDWNWNRNTLNKRGIANNTDKFLNISHNFDCGITDLSTIN